MNKIVTSVGLLAVGVSALHAAESSTLNPLQQTKPWSIQATLNGFYDDNVGTAPVNNQFGVETTGFDVTPEIKFGLPGEQTSFNVGYSLTARYYDKVPPNETRDDYTHTFDLDFAHAFSPRVDMSLSESFVIGQEPDLILDPAATQRYDGDNIRNYANIDFNFAATELLGFGVGYGNSFYDYDDEGATVTGGVVTRASDSGLLDRMEHLIRFNANYRLNPNTVGLVGYNYSQSIYSGDEAIAGVIGSVSPINGQVNSDSRDSRGHTFYVGAQHVFSPTLSGNLNGGVQYFSYYNSPTSDDGQWSPYLQGSLTYAFQTATSLEAGLSYNRQAANETGAAGYGYVRDVESATLYGNFKHQIMSKLIGTAKGTVSQAEYNGGGPGVDGETYLFYRLGLDLAYEFSQNFSGHIGYNYDKYDSKLAGLRDYDRNRVYIGVTAGF